MPDASCRRYAHGQKYDAHHDVGELTSVSGKQLAADGGYRVATALLYLTDVEEGCVRGRAAAAAARARPGSHTTPPDVRALRRGETAFPDSEWADPALAEGTWSECAEGGVAARARAGDALLFWSVMPNNEIDPASMHAGCPVIKARQRPSCPAAARARTAARGCADGTRRARRTAGAG
jgi:prolyl 4-hydroxylase